MEVEETKRADPTLQVILARGRKVQVPITDLKNGLDRGGPTFTFANAVQFLALIGGLPQPNWLFSSVPEVKGIGDRNKLPALALFASFARFAASSLFFATHTSDELPTPPGPEDAPKDPLGNSDGNIDDLSNPGWEAQVKGGVVPGWSLDNPPILRTGTLLAVTGCFLGACLLLYNPRALFAFAKI